MRPLGFASERRLAGNQAVKRRLVPIEIGFRPNLLGTDYMLPERLRLDKTAGVTIIRERVVDFDRYALCCSERAGAACPLRREG